MLLYNPSFFFLQKMSLKFLLIFGLLAALTIAYEIPCTSYLYQSKPDPENLYDETKSFVLPYGFIQTGHGVQLPLTDNMKWTYVTQYYEKQISFVKYIVAKGDRCDLCGIIGGAESSSGKTSILTFSSPGKVHTLDKCYKFIEINCYYPYSADDY